MQVTETNHFFNIITEYKEINNKFKAIKKTLVLPKFLLN